MVRLDAQRNGKLENTHRSSEVLVAAPSEDGTAVEIAVARRGLIYAAGK